MPTENERKYILNDKCELTVNELSTDQFNISQGYLIATRGITVRVRKSIKKSNGAVQYVFALKVNTNGRCIEVEKNLDKRDFDDLWAIALNKLEKIRYVFKHGKNTWELDFFKDYRGETYMAVAEVELPEDQMEPDTVPDVVKKNTIYKVGLTDTRFSNKLLGDARYAAELLNEILKK